jgi:hypothetical protein
MLDNEDKMEQIKQQFLSDDVSVLPIDVFVFVDIRDTVILSLSDAVDRSVSESVHRSFFLFNILINFGGFVFVLIGK